MLELIPDVPLTPRVPESKVRMPLAGFEGDVVGDCSLRHAFCIVHAFAGEDYGHHISQLLPFTII